MGIGKIIPGKLIRTLKKQRWLFFLVLILVSLAFGLVVGGCDGKTLTEPVIEPAVAPPEEPITRPTGWCAGKDDLYALLPGLDDPSAEGIQVEVCLAGGNNTYTIETELDPALRDLINPDTLPFPRTTLMAYFQVKDGAGKSATVFSPPLELRIRYTSQAWEQALEDPDASAFGRPRVAYLVQKEEGWAENWVEFAGTEITTVTEPGPGEDPYGYLYIIIEVLPDPAIGGC
jgi:hypothetical protein